MIYQAIVRSAFDTGCVIFEADAPSVLKKNLLILDIVKGLMSHKGWQLINLNNLK